jgi:hypothetical protein
MGKHKERHLDILTNIQSERGRRMASDESVKGGIEKQGDRPWRRWFITIFGKKAEGTAAVEGRMV